MREIRYRALQRDDKEWSYGSSFYRFASAEERIYTLPQFWKDVQTGYLDPETVGEWTGLKDRNGKDIFEGDKAREPRMCREADELWVVVWDDEMAGWYAENFAEGHRVSLASLVEVLEVIKSAYTPDGDYIGSSKLAHFLCKKRQIKPQLANASHKVCSIGFCASEQKWYGWSHRAMFGFGIGDVVKEGDCCASSGWIEEYLEEHPEADKSLPVGFQALNLEDCKRMAVAFADSVG